MFWVFFYENSVKLFLIMKLCLLFLLISTATLMGKNSYPQSTKLSLDLEDATLKELIEAIENQSDFIFVYYDGIVDLDKPININDSNKSVDKILKKVFKSTNNTYRIYDRQIVIGEKESKVDVLSTHSGKLQTQQENIIKGKVTDEESKPLPGATITIVGTTRGVITDNDGTYSIEAQPGVKMVFSFIGFESQIIDVRDQKTINVQMEEVTDELEEVTVVAFGTQKKESVVSSISTVDSKELKIPSSNLTTALAGQISGLVAYQSTGAPGEEDAQFFIRSVTSFGSGLTAPLILVDNIEVTSRDLSKLNPDDIASFSILKDASATALYGARGANGVVLVTTKEGKPGKVKVSFRNEVSVSVPTQDVKVADPITFMEYFNIASQTRYGTETYSRSKINLTKDPNRNEYVYPAVDWKGMLTKNHSINNRSNINLTGGGERATYYLAGTFSHDNGILNVDKKNPYNTNIDLKNYSVRSNVNLNLTKTLEAKVRFSANFEDYTGPIGEFGSGGGNTYAKALMANPVYFPAYFAPDRETQYVDRILFGNYSDDPYGEVGSPAYLNPYAEVMKGYEDVRNSTLLAQLELHQDLNFITEGLKARFIGSVTRYSGFNIERSYDPYYYQYVKGSLNPYDDEFPYTLTLLNPEDGTDYIDYSAGGKSVNSRTYGEGTVLYNRTFGNHDLGALLVGSYKEILDGSPRNLDSSLPSRNISFAGRFTHAFLNKYFAEFNFGLNGSERFDANHRWGFFPSIGVGWQISEENFWTGLKDFINKFKIRASYGLVGNDVIVSNQDRFFFTSNVNLNGANAGYFGNDPTSTYYRPTISISRHANPYITWEVSYKTNLAIELGLFDNELSFQAEFYHENRTNIVQPRVDIPSTTGLTSSVRTNYGEAIGKGVDLMLDYSNSITNDIWYILRGNFTYGISEITKYEELDYSDFAPWRSVVGRKVGQTQGYVAERLFIDDEEVKNSPEQRVTSSGAIYQGGDIKYRDINSDGVIDQFDIVPMGYPSNPEIQYGFGGSMGYKSFDLSIFFQGSARYSFFLNANNLAPFIEVSSGGKKGNRALLDFIVEDVWTETNKDLYAGWPRLAPDTQGTPMGNDNNFVNSNYWMRSPNYLRLKSLEIGYTAPMIKGMSPRIYVSGTNLLTFSNFKLWDPEMRGNGLRYPIQKVFNVGLLLDF